jgi:hypothetical protein
MKELEAWGEQRQRLLHFQGFGRVPVDDLLAPVKDKVAKLARERQLAAITISCDFTSGEVEVVDITDDLVKLYDPSEKTLGRVRAVRGAKPAPLTQIADMPAKRDDAAKIKRIAYVVRHGAVKDLAATLTKHFKGTAEIQTGPEGTSSCLLINAPTAVFEEIMKTLEQLDRRPHSVAVEVFVVELPTKKADDKDKRPGEKELSGTIDDVAARLDAMIKKGEVVSFKRIQLTTLEGHPGLLMLGENKPYAMGPNTTVYRNVGTQVKVTPQVTADRSVTLDLNVQDNRGRDSATVAGLTEFIQTSLSGKISVASGKAALAKDAKVISREGEGETLIVVGARFAESEAKAKEDGWFRPSLSAASLADEIIVASQETGERGE